MKVEYTELTLKCVEEIKRRFDSDDWDLWTHQVATVGAVYPAGYYEISDNQACHAGLSSLSLGSEYVVSVIMEPSRDLPSYEDKSLFLNWLMNDSNYSKAFVTKDASQALSDGFLVLDSSVSTTYLMPACVASRTITEWPHVCEVFCDLVRNDVKGNVAFLIANLARTQTGRGGQLDWTNSDGGHRVIYPTIYDKEAFHNYMNDKPVQEVLAPYQEDGNYSGYSVVYSPEDKGVWGHTQKGNIVEWIGERFSYELNESSTTKNPFHLSLPKKEEQSTLPYSVGISRMVEFINTHLKGDWYDE